MPLTRVPCLGVDYSWGRPDPTHLVRDGYLFVGRYVVETRGGPPGKALTREEATELSRAGLSIVAIYQPGKTFMLGGHTAGARDAAEGLQAARDAGMPPCRPLYFPVDFDATASQLAAVTTYLEGAASVLGPRCVGVYGGLRTIIATRLAWARAHDAPLFTWQTRSWSTVGGEVRWEDVHLRQFRVDQKTDPVRYEGHAVDFDSAHRRDVGQWKVS